MKILPEQRFLLSAVLLCVAEQETQFVKIKHRTSDRDQRTRQKISETAREFVQSVGFDAMCYNAGFDANYLRSKTPAEAYQAFKRVESDGAIEEIF